MKKILICLIILSHSVFSQTKINSKILSILTKELGVQKIYNLPLDSALSIYKNNIISQQKNVDLKKDQRRSFSYSDSKSEFEDVIKINSKKLMFNKYKSDTITFYFNNQKINKVAFNFKLFKTDIEALEKSMKEKLGSSGYSSSRGWGGPNWHDNYSKLSFFFSDKDTTGFFNLEFEMFEKEITNEIETRNGKGNASFVPNITFSNKLLKTNSTRLSLEKLLPEFSVIDSASKTYDYNPVTLKHDIIKETIYEYNFMYNNQYEVFVSVYVNKNQIIKKMEFKFSIEPFFLNYTKQRAENGFVINEAMTKMVTKMGLNKCIVYDNAQKIHLTEYSSKHFTIEKY